MRDPRADNKRFFVAHRELEFMDFADAVLHRRLHQKATETQIQQRDWYVERPDHTFDAAKNFDPRITPPFRDWIHGDGFYLRGDALHIYLKRNT